MANRQEASVLTMNVLLVSLQAVLIAVDLLITLVTFGWVKALLKLFTPEPLRSVPVADNESHRVHADFKDGLIITQREGIETVYDLAKDSFERYANRNCMGVREFVGQKTLKVKEFGGIQWRSFEQAGKEAFKFGAALRSVGLVPAPDETTLDKIKTPCSIAIFENTSPEWLLAALGAFSQSIIVTTIYATLGIDAVIDAVNDGIISAIVCNKKNVKILVDVIKKMPTLKIIVYTNDMLVPGEMFDLPAAPKGVKIVAFDEFVESGSNESFPPRPPKPSTCAVIMYTSGSTGRPKGVVVTHAHIIAAIAALRYSLAIENGKDVYLGYLPLAHILELTAQLIMLGMGCTICYADPKTLTTTGAYPIGALEQFSPTLMAGVPKVWDTLKKGVQAKVATSSPLSQVLVKTAFQAKTCAMKHGYDTPLFNALVFKKFSKVVGGKLRGALSGGGPLNGEVQEFVTTCFGCPLFQGYGMTETCAGLTIQDPFDFRGGIAGVPIPSLEVKLISCPDVLDKAGQPYLNKDRFDVDGNPVFGRGEIHCRGNNISVGYYMMPDKTKELYLEDGWFSTGDIGQFMSDGSISIVDRKKNLVKLKGGEYVALEQMEAAYGSSDFVDAIAGGICCYGDGDMDRPVSLMQLNTKFALSWAQENGVDGDYETIKTSQELMTAVMEDMKKLHAKNNLSHIEKLVAVTFVSTPWTPENGCLTAANKLQRRVVVSTHAKEFEALKRKGIF